ncbi:MAG: YkgJ family cysteine cluster protein [Ardenticatenaceae bacterium]|nr:YkgJ family cysteine cluster protein [Anaerolineales bacterium]MCB8921380.1 YkgJ family cysteine cluster protein [Ardenticatenaceae bacterium]MCB8991502.1 YkgJ family cysteine cluster protein [Ardenticatenaceae bacterium]MCB9003996.1 YkgJ family cysteine cluster protein [Ardenticatenaceae bacterium]
MSVEHVCQCCGACCATYRVSFYWAEAAPEFGGTVPPELTEQLNEVRAVMKGTKHHPTRCVALEGQVKGCVRCTIYEQRPSPCRTLKVSWEDGTPSDLCNRARLAWGLPPLRPEDLLTIDEAYEKLATDEETAVAPPTERTI